MIYFTLPAFCYFNKVNNIIHRLVRTETSKLKNSNIIINAQSGCIPFQCWNGDVNNNIGDGMFYPEFIRLQESSELNLRFNFASILLEEYDYYDDLGNTVLKMFDGTGTFIEISSIPFMEFLQERYPYYDFIFSKQADIINPFTEDVLKTLTEQDCFRLIGLPDRMLSDLSMLKKLPKKNKLELTVDPLCPLGCEEYVNCMLTEQQNQLKYSSMSVFHNCSKCFLKENNPQLITIEQIENTYLPLGFNHFIFSTSYKNVDKAFQLVFYIQYFFKPEYWNEITKKGLNILNGEIENGQKN